MLKGNAVQCAYYQSKMFSSLVSRRRYFRLCLVMFKSILQLKTVEHISVYLMFPEIGIEAISR
jgi:hypothetical protein